MCECYFQLAGRFRFELESTLGTERARMRGEGMPFIAMELETNPTEDLRRVYDFWRQRQGIVPNVVKALSLRPALLVANDDFRRAIIWGASSLGRRREEMIATLISNLVGCTY